MILKRPFISDTGEDSALYIQCSDAMEGKASASRQPYESVELYLKEGLKKPYVSDTWEASAHLCRYPGTQSIIWVTEVYMCMEVYSKDGLEKAIY